MNNGLALKWWVMPTKDEKPRIGFSHHWFVVWNMAVIFPNRKWMMIQSDEHIFRGVALKPPIRSICCTWLKKYCSC